ncbi:hypothetical protein B0G81_2393 [Paraburkholderia sp. BL6665CI2N2]|uniref:hypothetical protein n=1 Tax=Paraburkholderia sp. BL6665CI2N2 TaxID=1938806 RepID=UPI001066A3BB|nr:hypothetical protein [Paraburkholderia sp. BL6665CI2N2]TDY22107.1 hypothetical protein B0G81_2393 [Paraburkholderia sp. BL6665CI2N2]
MTTVIQATETSADDDEYYPSHYTDDALQAIDDFCSDYPSRDLKTILDEAARLIDIHDNGTIEYYAQLEPQTVGRWVLGSAWDVPTQYDDQNVSLTREILTHYCAVMRRASEYASQSRYPTVRYLNDEDGLETTTFSERQIAVDSLRYPGLLKAAQSLIESRRHRARLGRHDSARQAQHSYISDADWPELFQPIETPLECGTYNRMWLEALPEPVRELTEEQFILVIPCGASSGQEAAELTQDATPKLILNIDPAGEPVACEVFAGGALRIPVVANRNLFTELRSHLAVVYVFTGHALLVEYPWNQITLGIQRIEKAELLERQALEEPTLVSVTWEGTAPCRFMVNRIVGLLTDTPHPIWMDDIRFEPSARIMRLSNTILI